MHVQYRHTLSGGLEDYAAQGGYGTVLHPGLAAAAVGGWYPSAAAYQGYPEGEQLPWWAAAAAAAATAILTAVTPHPVPRCPAEHR